MMKHICIIFLPAILILQSLNSHLAAEAYQNFHVAIYCTVDDVAKMDDLVKLEKTVDLIEKSFRIDKVYLETHRHNFLIDEKTLVRAKNFFENRGIATSGGITTTGDKPVAEHFPLYCYSDNKNREHLEKVVAFTAKHFDEMIIDDFFFTNCRCQSCINKKGTLSWADFRLDLMREISEDVVIKTAKEVRPDVNMIIKFPNWYEYYQYTGYNLKDEPALYDMIYTGTETRDPQYHQQHLQPYQSYLIMRYLENIKPGKNGGGWVDPLDMGNLNRYAGQITLTLFAGAREVTLFHLNSLTEWVHQEKEQFEPVSLVAPAAGYVFEKTDKFLHKLGRPIGLPSYKPVNSSGEEFLHNYLGMTGIPIELSPDFPEESKTVLLTASAAYDPDIIEKMKKHLSAGKDLIISSGLLKELESRGIQDIIEAGYTDQKFLAGAYSDFNFTHIYPANEEILFPVMSFPTNDTWMEITALGGENSYPLVLKSEYGNGLIYVLTIPDNYADLYKIPDGTLSLIRQIFLKDFKVLIEAPGKVCIFLYDNNTFIVHSFLPHKTNIKLRIKQQSAKLMDLISNQELRVEETGKETIYQTILTPDSYRVFQYQ